MPLSPALELLVQHDTFKLRLASFVLGIVKNKELSNCPRLPGG